MTTQIKPQPHLTFLDSGKCFICGQGVSDEGYLKPLQMHFCQRHLAELLQKIMDWANNETFYRQHYKNYSNPALKQNDTHFDNQSNKER